MIKEEIIKAEKHPFDAWEDLLRASREGFVSIQPNDLIRFRWFGLYQQRPKSDPYFMLRLKIPGGRVNSKQLRAVAETAEKYGREIADITTRQNFQFHWITVEDIPAIFSKFESLGIITKGGGGDTGRNITSSPLAGLERDEVDDLEDVILELQDAFLADKSRTNLPRKFKVSITGSPKNNAQPEINDVGIYGYWRQIGNSKEAAFALRVAGGLSSDPMFSRALPVVLKRKDIVSAVLAVLEIFRDFGNRENRRRARLKFLMAEWGVKKFLEELEKRLGHKLERSSEIPHPINAPEDPLGIIPQKQKGLFSIGLAVLAGRLAAKELLRLAELSEKYASGELRTTDRQNIIIVNIPEKNVSQLEKELRSSGFDLGENGIYRSVVCCTGTEFCNMATTETKQFTKKLIAELVREFPDLKEPVTIHVTGCPNACGQPQVADIGLTGTLKIGQGKKEEAYHVALGARLGEAENFNHVYFKTVPAGRVFGLIESIVKTYLAKRRDQENFSAFFNRIKAEGENIETFFTGNKL